jgi:hypothetical protein
MLMLAPHRRRLAVLWVALAILISVIVQGTGRDYTNNFTRPGTESQRVSYLLTKRFPSQSDNLEQPHRITSGRASTGAHRDPPGQVLTEEMGG